MMSRSIKHAGALFVLLAMLGAVMWGTSTNTYAIPLFAGGNGSAEEPYQIETAQQLAAMSENLTASYELIDDIDLTNYVAEGGEGWHDGAGWVPIGTPDTRFSGVFDGQGYTITGLMIDRSSDDYQGLFGYTASGSVIKNIGLIDVDVKGGTTVGGLAGGNNGTITNAYTTGVVAGNERVGGLAGGNYNANTVIKDSHSSAHVTGANNVGGLVGGNYVAHISHSYASGSVAGADKVGGLLGDNNGTLASSYATGTVTGNQNVGGLVGGNFGEITHSFASGAVTGTSQVGGLVGGNYVAISHSYATGNVKGWISNVGGLTGINYSSITNTYATGNVSGNQPVGGLVGSNYDSVALSYYDNETTGQSDTDKGEGRSTAQMKQQATFDWDFTSTSNWTITEGLSYPVLQVADTTPPAVIRADVEDAHPDQVVIVFNESVTIDDASGITVNVEGNAATVTAAVYDLDTRAVTVTIDQVIEFGENVTLSYSSGLGTIEDQADNASPDFTEAVINHVGKIVSFDSDGGSFVGFIRVSSGSLLEAPVAPTKTGYTFISWYKEESLTNEWDFSTDTVNENVVLYAGWVQTPQLELGDQSGNAGEPIEVPLSLASGENISAIEFDLSFDSDFLTLLTDAGDIADIQFNAVGDGEYRVLIGNAENELIPDAIGNLRFTIAEGKAYQAATTVTLSNMIASNTDAVSLAAAEDGATVTVSDTVAPTLTLSATGPDYTTKVDISLSVVEEESSIVTQKWTLGAVDLSTIKANGTVFTGNLLAITENGTYTLYVEDEAGNGKIATIDISNYVVKGDAKTGDGQYTVDIADWQTVANFILLKEVPDERQTFAADMNDDDSINVGDWVAIANKLIAD